MSMPKIEKPIETVTLSYAEYVGTTKYPSKYFIVNALRYDNRCALHASLASL